MKRLVIEIKVREYSNPTIVHAMFVIAIVSCLCAIAISFLCVHIIYHQRMNYYDDIINQPIKDCYRVESTIFYKNTNTVAQVSYSNIFKTNWEAVQFGMRIINNTGRNDIAQYHNDIIPCVCNKNNQR